MATYQWPKERRLLGTRVQRIDAPDKATGLAKYSFDINRPGMLHARILRCPYGHAKLTKLGRAEWLRETDEGVFLALRELGSASGAQLSAAEPRLRTQLVFPDEGKSYVVPQNVTSRVLMLLSAEGHIVRGRPRGGWSSGTFTYHSRQEWLNGGLSALDGLDAGAARTELARRWLLVFGPAPVSDLQWWTGWTGCGARCASCCAAAPTGSSWPAPAAWCRTTTSR